MSAGGNARSLTYSPISRTTARSTSNSHFDEAGQFACGHRPQRQAAGPSFVPGPGEWAWNSSLTAGKARLLLFRGKLPGMVILSIDEKHHEYFLLKRSRLRVIFGQIFCASIHAV
jgi:hypothetical protein